MATYIRSLVQLRGFIELVQGGSEYFNPPDLENNNPPSSKYYVNLTTGANTVNCPANAYGAIIICDPNSTVAKTVAGAVADTGIPINPSGWCFLNFPSVPPTHFVISAAAQDPTNRFTVVQFT